MTCIVYTYTQDHFQVSWLTAHVPRPGALDSWLTAHGPRLGARLRPWLQNTNFLPIAQRARAKHFHFGLVANPTAHGSGVRAPARVRCPRLAAQCEALALALGHQFPSLWSSCSGQALSFWARSKSHGSRLGGPYPGSRLMARGLVRSSGLGSRLPISFPFLIVLGPSTLVLAS
jgi:hypothetical protein